MEDKRLVKDFLYEDESYKIIDAAKEVVNEIGGGFKEKIYDNSLTIALKKKNLQIERQKRIKIFFSKEQVGIYVPDIIVKSERIRFLNAELEEASIPGEQVIIEDNYFSQVNAQPVSSTNYSAEEIRRAATISGDVTRIVNGLPSLSNENEGNHLIAKNIEPISKIGFYSKVKAISSFNPQEYSCILRN